MGFQILDKHIHIDRLTKYPVFTLNGSFYHLWTSKLVGCTFFSSVLINVIYCIHCIVKRLFTIWTTIYFFFTKKDGFLLWSLYLYKILILFLFLFYTFTLENWFKVIPFIFHFLWFHCNISVSLRTLMTCLVTIKCRFYCIKFLTWEEI